MPSSSGPGVLRRSILFPEYSGMDESRREGERPTPLLPDSVVSGCAPSPTATTPTLKRVRGWFAVAVTLRGPGVTVTIALVCGTGPFVAACYGYGSYLRCTWPWAWLLTVPVGLWVLCCHGLLRRLRLLIRGKPSEGRMSFRWREVLAVLSISCLSFFAGWGPGKLCRDAYCRRIRAKCEPVLVALEAYRAEHGAYPEALAVISNIEALKSDAGIVICDDRFSKHGVDVGIMDNADAVIYLDPHRYTCVVPIERRLPMSFTPFYVYLRNSGDVAWVHDYIIWYIGIED